jgi:hypothetical protein
MASNTLGNIEKEIRTLQRRLASIGNMRPGTLSVQYRDPAAQKTPFNQISYTYQGRSRSEYVRPENLATVRREINAYKRFKALCSRIVDCSIRASRLRAGTRATQKSTKQRKPRTSGGT